MLSPIVITKLFIPQPRPELVHRPRLLAQLNKGLTRKLTLISAPAGFGKTTLVADWAHRSLLSDTRMAWISLDKDDNDPSLFLTYLIVAFKQVGCIDENLAERLLDMLQSPQSPPVKDVVTTIINAVAELSSRLIIVFDDYHLIEETFVNEALAFLIEHLPPQLHLVIVTRDDPYLPLARLRAKGKMNYAQPIYGLQLSKFRNFYSKNSGLTFQAMILLLSKCIPKDGSLVYNWLLSLLRDTMMRSALSRALAVDIAMCWNIYSKKFCISSPNISKISCSKQQFSTDLQGLCVKRCVSAQPKQLAIPQGLKRASKF
jgi:hypothetical protein